MDTIRDGSSDRKIGNYPREELFFSTVAEKYISINKIGHPFVFSEVHRFDRKLWKDYKIMDHCYEKIARYFLSRDYYSKIRDKYFRFSLENGQYKTTPEIVDYIRKKDSNYINKNKYLDDGYGKFELYGDTESLFAVKRVSRDISDPLRRYITNLA